MRVLVLCLASLSVALAVQNYVLNKKLRAWQDHATLLPFHDKDTVIFPNVYMTLSTADWTKACRIDLGTSLSKDMASCLLYRSNEAGFSEGECTFVNDGTLCEHPRNWTWTSRKELERPIP